MSSPSRRDAVTGIGAPGTAFDDGDAGGTGIAPLSDAEFELFRTLIYREAGIHLTPAKKPLLTGRLASRLRELGLRSFGAYYRHAADGRPGEIAHLLDRITTNETRFFREGWHFEFLEREVFPRWRTEDSGVYRRKTIRCWSAGCSTGEEPYSLAMVLRAAFPAEEGWTLRILGTDISGRVVERARAGVWPVERAREIPREHLERFMLRGTGDRIGTMKAGPELRRLVTIHRLNLNDDAYPVVGPFDLIFCRNVLIYFDATSKKSVVDRLLDRLDPGGYFFLGHSESLRGVTDRVRGIAPAVYTEAGGPGAAGPVRERPARATAHDVRSETP